MGIHIHHSLESTGVACGTDFVDPVMTSSGSGGLSGHWAVQSNEQWEWAVDADGQWYDEHSCAHVGAIPLPPPPLEVEEVRGRQGIPFIVDCKHAFDWIWQAVYKHQVPYGNQQKLTLKAYL